MKKTPKTRQPVKTLFVCSEIDVFLKQLNSPRGEPVPLDRSNVLKKLKS